MRYFLGVFGALALDLLAHCHGGLGILQQGLHVDHHHRQIRWHGGSRRRSRGDRRRRRGRRWLLCPRAANAAAQTDKTSQYRWLGAHHNHRNLVTEKASLKFGTETDPEELRLV